MRTFITFVLLIAALFIGCLFAGCSSTQVAPGHDPFVVRAESDMMTSWRVVDAFLAWEHANRDSVGPGVTSIADDLRVRFPGYLTSAEFVLRTYKRHRTPELRADTQTWLITLQTAMQQALRYLPTPETDKALRASNPR